MSGELWMRTDKSVQASVDDSVVLLDIENGKYHSLNRTASEIWNLLDKPRALVDIENILADKFELPDDGISKSVVKTITYFEANKLIEIVNK